MRKLAIAGAGVAVLGAGLLLAETFPVGFAVVRSAAVAAAPPVVFARLSDLRTYPQWSKLASQHVPGTDRFEGSGVGMSWTFTRTSGDSPGKIVLDVAQPPARVEMHAVNAPPANPKTSWTIEPAGTGSKVTLRFEGELRLLGKLARLVRPPEELIGKLLEDDLASLDASLKASPADAGQ
jgi:ribosome-associated toxin RatA of RatAB toxin-antitoxin module